MKIRQISASERAAISVPLQVYGFRPSPAADDALEKMRDAQRYSEGNVTLVAEENGAAVAEASAIPMRQNVRGVVFPMAGVAGVSALPLDRRRGLVRALLTGLLGQMRDAGHVLSALYPFRPSFYQRFGYIGLPKDRTVRFCPADLAVLLRAELGGETRWGLLPAGYDVFREFTKQLLAQRHGFALFPDYRALQLRDAGGRWLVTAHAGGEVAGAVTYRIAGHADDLIADELLATSPLGRALLLQFFARHVDQVATIVTTVAADELPELWATDIAAVTQAKISFPDSAAPMARVLSLDGLTGLPVGPGRAAVEIVGDPFVAGRYVLDGMSGILEVRHGQAPAPAATLTAAGLSGLVYGVLDPGDIMVRQLGDVPPDAAAGLRALFPRRTPQVFASF
jgi:predicted N-acetyltransferase YhbS